MQGAAMPSMPTTTVPKARGGPTQARTTLESSPLSFGKQGKAFNSLGMSTSFAEQSVLLGHGPDGCLSRVRTNHQVSGELNRVIFENVLGYRNAPSKFEPGGHDKEITIKEREPVLHGNGFLKMQEAGKERSTGTGGKHNAAVKTWHEISNARGL